MILDDREIKAISDAERQRLAAMSKPCSRCKSTGILVQSEYVYDLEFVCVCVAAELGLPVTHVQNITLTPQGDDNGERMV